MSPLSTLQGLRGRLREQADLSKTTWFQVGGAADYLFKPEDTDDLALFLREKPCDLRVTVIGVGSNLLVRDGGVEGMVVRLGRGFAEIKVMNDTGLVPAQELHSTLYAGAAALDLNIAHFAADHGIKGLEFLSGIPGTLGGAVAMNAGAYGSDISQILVSADIVLADGEQRRLSNKECGFSYRKSELPEGAIVTGAVLKGEPGEREKIRARITDIQRERETTQPVKSRTGGSTFKNPDGHKAWELIDAAGCRGLMIGGAQVSEKHCNFLINTGSATAADLEALGEEVRRRVYEKSGVTLEWEIKRIGKI